jgi:hypothetical protein
MMESIKSLFSPKTIPFLISQGVVPKLLPVGTLVLGILFGFIWAYGVSPTVYTAAEPVHMGDSWKSEYLKQAAWQMQANGNTPEAQQNTKRQLDALGDAPRILGLVMGTIPANDPLVPILQTLEAAGLAQTNQPQLDKVTPGFLNGNFMPVLCILVPLILFGGAVIVNTIIPITLLFQRRSTVAPTVVSGQDKARRDAMAAAKAQAAAAPPPVTTIERGAPTGQYMSTYIMGDDLYDDSFSVETASGEFLGETGSGISKTIGVGDPKKVSATEVWVFDKNDIKTVTKVLMSEHAFNDEGIRAELAPKGEAVAVKQGSIVMLETQTLTVQARVVDLAYGSGSLPPNSFFERLTVEISAWPKKAGQATAGAAADAFGETGPIR